MKMEFPIEINNDISNKFSSYKDMLNVLTDFKRFQREIKINTLLTDKKILFEVDDLPTRNQFIGQYLENIENSSINAFSILKDKKIDFKIHYLSFIIIGNEVKSINCKLKITNKDLENDISNGLKIKVYPSISNERVNSFYIIKED